MVNKKSEIRNRILKATNQGELKIGERILPVAVLEDGTRVITLTGVFSAFGRTTRSKINVGNRVISMPSFLDAQNLQPFVTQPLKEVINQITYFNKSGKETKGYNALLLPLLCDVYLNARDAKALTKKQYPLAVASDVLVRSLSKVGIVALVDEATGYQKEKNEYQKILELYIANEIQPWIHTFDENYYRQLYRLQGWDWDAFKNKKKNHPQYIGKLTNRLIYEKLAPGVLQELQKINPKDDKGNRKTKHFQRLTDNIGYRELLKLLSAVTILMEQFPDRDLVGAIQKIDARFPTVSAPSFQTAMDFPAVANKKTFDSAIRLASKPVKALGGKVE
ncbi:MAG: P63C domain-containing protein [Patescibacteria group bacterium]|mgnify:CR=1 FL=1